MLLGATGASTEEQRILSKNPQLERLFNQFLDERLKKEKARTGGESSGSTLLSTANPALVQDASREGNTKFREKGQYIQNTANAQNQTIKSPSDTTIYVPAIQRAKDQSEMLRLGDMHLKDRFSNEQSQFKAVGHEISNNPTQNKQRNSVNLGLDHEMIEKISNFVDELRVGHEELERRRTSEVTVPGYDDAKKRADRAVLEAERFKASIANPPGIEIQDKFQNPIDPPVNTFIMGGSMGNNEQIQNNDSPRAIGTGLSDDDFFHLTCHIDAKIRQKIEQGGFIDLDLLLPKEKNGSFDRFGSEDKVSGTPMQWVQNEQGTFLMPARKQSKINGFRRWEQAFRIYATLYCSANPNRSREIWQYISVINTAASAYIWDNVYNYDIIFRQLMEFNPARSWAVTYNQMWNLSMREPLQKTFKSLQSNGATN